MTTAVLFHFLHCLRMPSVKNLPGWYLLNFTNPLNAKLVTCTLIGDMKIEILYALPPRNILLQILSINPTLPSTGSSISVSFLKWQFFSGISKKL
jgi:hypothetical protein